MNIKILTDEKIKNKDHLAAIKEYEKRLTRYCKLKRIEQYKPDILEKSYVIKIDDTAESLTSEDFASKINSLGVSGKSDIIFVYTNKDIEYDEVLGLSNMKLSTGMFSIVMLEQIYRGYRILRNEPYHK